jgi:hypothetical protein
MKKDTANTVAGQIALPMLWPKQYLAFSMQTFRFAASY